MANSKKLFDKAEKLLQKQKYDSALKIFLKLFDDQPHNEVVLLNLVDVSVRLDRSETSLRYNRLLADLYIERKDISKAVVTCRKILKAAPQDFSTLAKLALLLKDTHKTTEAVEAFREAAAAYRTNGDTAHALECFRQVVELEPGSVEAHIELAELAGDSGNKALAAETLLRAAAIARKNGMDDRWAGLAERAYQLNPANEAGRITIAEVYLDSDRARDAIAVLEAMPHSNLNDASVLNLLCRAYLSSSEYGKAEPICLKLYESDHRAVGLTEQLIRGLLNKGETARALAVVNGIKERTTSRQERQVELLASIEQIYHADENNLDVLELLPPLYIEFNREGDLRCCLSRLFNLYIAAERYGSAADTLEGLLDVDPYGAGHSDRLLNLEGHIDAIWYNNIASRISLPGTGQGLQPDPSVATDEDPAPGTPEALDNLIVEGEMFHRYHLDAKLDETLKKIDRLYPGAHESNEPLRGLYELAGFCPTPVQHTPETDIGRQGEQGQLPVEKLEKLSDITGNIHRQGTSERVLSVVVDHLGRLIGAGRCWVALGPPDSAAPLTAEYVSAGVPPSDAAAAFKVWSFLMHQPAVDSASWSIDNVSGSEQYAPIAPELEFLGITSLLAVRLTNREELVGLLLVEQYRESRQWTGGERLFLENIAPQIVIAINNTKLRRLVRSLAGTDAATGLLPRSAYLDCLLAEATRAEEQSRPLSVCLIELADAGSLTKTFGEEELQSYFQVVSGAISSHVRQNDIAIRYGPYAIALCLPDTPLAQSRAVVEKLRQILPRTNLNGGRTPDICAAVGEPLLGPGFDAVDAVTEIINRLEASMEILRKKPKGEILVSQFEG